MTENNGGQQEFTPPATQEELNQIIKSRLDREQKKFADYEDLKQKAAELDQLKSANQSDLEKAIARAETAEAKIKDFESREQIASWKNEVATATGVPVEALVGSTLDELNAHAEVLKQYIKPATEPVAPPVILGQEKSPANVSESPERDVVRKLFGKD